MSDPIEAMSELIEDLVSREGEFVPAIEADKLVAHLRANDPSLLRGWLDAVAVQFLTRYISDRLRAKRTLTYHRAKARAFGNAASDAAAGDDRALRHFAVFEVVDDDNTRRPVGEMTGTDHLYVAEKYHQSGTYDLMLEAFHRAIAEKVGRRKTKEVLTEEKYDEMFQSIVRRPGARERLIA